MHEDLIDALAATPKGLAYLVGEASDAQLDAAAADGGWSARVTLAHLRDDEYLGNRLALERMLAEERPALVFTDGADWATGRNTTRDGKRELLADFALQRQASLAILRGLRPGDWERTGTTAAHGQTTIARLLYWWAAHDAEHIAQLEAALGVSLAAIVASRTMSAPG